MNQYPEDHDRDQDRDCADHNNEEANFDSKSTENDPFREEPRWYGISYQNQNGYYPPMSFYEVETPKKQKKRKIALIAALVALCMIFTVVAVSLSGYFNKTPDLTDPNASTYGTPTSSTGNGSGGGTLYEDVTGSDYDYSSVTLQKNDGTGLADHANGSAGDNAGTIISATARVKDAVVEILTTTSNSYQTITAGVGSGVIIHADGIIVTNNHVVDGLDTIYVRLTNGNTYKATVRGTDEDGDIAVIKIEPQETLTVASLGYSGALALGEPVIAIGNPLGELGGTVTNGIISATQRAIQVEDVTMTLIQTNAAINAGNSGGGLFNLAGELIGIVNAKISAEGVEGLGFAIPIDTAVISINHLLKLGYIPGTPSLGISVTVTGNVTLNGRSVYIPVVSESGNGLEKGDYIYSVNGVSTYVYKSWSSGTADDALALLKNEIRAHKVGETLTVRVYRNNEWKEVSVTLVEYVPVDVGTD